MLVTEIISFHINRTVTGIEPDKYIYSTCKLNLLREFINLLNLIEDEFKQKEIDSQLHFPETD